MADIKNALRCNLGGKHLDCLLHIYHNLTRREPLPPMTDPGFDDADKEAQAYDLDIATKTVIHWNNVKTRRGGLTGDQQDELESTVDSNFVTKINEDYDFGSSKVDLDQMASSGALQQVRVRREANRNKRDVQPIPTEACTQPAGSMPAGQPPVFESVGRFPFANLGHVTLQSGDWIAHWWDDLATNPDKTIKTPGWAVGQLKGLDRAKGTYDVACDDGLVGHDSKLSPGDYGEHKIWVLLMTTTADAAGVPARAPASLTATTAGDDGLLQTTETETI